MTHVLSVRNHSFLMLRNTRQLLSTVLGCHFKWQNCQQKPQKDKKHGIKKMTKRTKLGKEYVKAVYCRLAYLTHMQSTS